MQDIIKNNRNTLAFRVSDYQKELSHPDIRAVYVNFFTSDVSTTFSERVIAQHTEHKLSIPKRTPKELKLVRKTLITTRSQYNEEPVPCSVYLAHINASQEDWFHTMKELDAKILFDVKYRHFITVYIFDIDNIKDINRNDHNLFARFGSFLNDETFFFHRFLFTTFSPQRKDHED